MKYIMITILATLSIACTGNDRFESKAFKCLDQAWADDDLARVNGLGGMSHQAMYNACLDLDERGLLPLISVEEYERED